MTAIEKLLGKNGLDAKSAAQYANATSIKPVSYKKNDIIFRTGKICNAMFYITNGITRAYYIDDDKEVNLRLVASDNVALQYSSLLSQEKSTEVIAAISDCSGYLIQFDNIDQLASTVPEHHKFLRTLAENHYLAMERRLYMLQHKSGLERYRYFLKTMPEEIIHNTPRQHIASYLGLTAESFSRIKRELNK
jgi:CRP-like cAMP-binding protein